MTDDSEKLDTKFHELLYGVRRSVRYHTRRRRFFEHWHRLTSGAGVILGSATVAALIQDVGSGLAPWLAALVAVLGAIDLVVGTSKLAWLHADLARRFIALEKEIIAVAPSDDSYRSLSHARLDIEMDEPPVLHVLNKICDNDMVRAMGYDDDQLLDISWYQRLVAHFFDINPHAIRRRCQSPG